VRLRFDDFVLDLDERVLFEAEVERALEPKVFECLALLVSQAGKLTSMEQLRSRLWPDVSVGEGALRRVINEARKAIGDNGSAQSRIRTRKGLGYVFVASVVSEAPVPAEQRAGAGHVWPFVGREREIERLRGWQTAAAGGGLCLVSGEAGAGKSSLLVQFQAGDQLQARCLIGHCQATLGLPAYWPFREIAAQLMRFPELRARIAPVMRQPRNVLRAIPEFGDDASWGGVGAEAHFELCEAFGALLATLSQTVPLRLVLEDLHWADAGSIAMLDAVARAARGRALHVFATYRPEAVTPGTALSHFIGRTSGREGVISLHLDAFSVDDIQQLLGALRVRGWAGGTAQVLHRQTGGNALFLSELVRHALALDLPLDAALPPSVAHIVEQRVRALPEETQRRLGQAAVLGHELSLEVLSVLAGSPSASALLGELEPARRSGVLARDPDNPERWLFSHALVGDALVERLSLQDRHAYHCAALRAWQSLRGPAAPSGVLAAHAFEAGLQLSNEERRRFCEQAGRDAFETHVFDRAVLHLGRAIQLLDPEDRSAQAAELNLLWARARWHADDAETEIERAFLQAAEYARRADLPEHLAQAAIGFALGDESSIHLRAVALRPEALELLEEAWARLVRATEGGVEALCGEVPYRLAAALCWMRCEAGDLGDFERAARLALRLAPPSPDPFRKLWLLALEGVADAERADQVHAASIAWMQQHDLSVAQRIEVWALTMGSRLAYADLDGYERAVREVESLVERLPQPGRIGRHGARLSAYIAVPRCARAAIAVMGGRFKAALDGFSALAEQSVRLGLALTPEQANHMFCMLLWLQAYEGRCSQLEPLIDRHLKANPDSQWFCALAQAQFALERGELELARAHFRILRETGFRPHLRGKPLLAKPETLVRVADACVEAGTPEDAAILYAALLPRAQQCIQDGALICLGACARPLAELAHQLGRPLDAERHFADALAINERLQHRPELVRTQLGWARFMLAGERRGPAAQLIEDARRSAEQMGMRPALALAEQLEAQCDEPSRARLRIAPRVSGKRAGQVD
jgi:DNA-binding winged helix-turn-helix (wHTH) protein